MKAMQNRFKRMQGILGAILACLLAGLGDVRAADDYGDSPSTAFLVAPGSNVVAGKIDIDVDKDWFAFQAMPSVAYTITVSTGTLWDSVVTFKAPDGLTTLCETSSVADHAPATLIWTNTGAMSTFFIQVGGFAEFTTGTYTLAVSGPASADGDGDGLPDSWEIQYFGSTAPNGSGDYDGDGQSNQAEFYMGTNPNNPGSGLVITDIRRETNTMKVTWSVVRYGTYRLSANTNATSAAVWKNIATNLILNNPGVQSYNDLGTTPLPDKRYRVEFLY